MTLRRSLLLAAPLMMAAGRAPTVSMDLPGAYGARLRTAKAKAFHLHNQPADSTVHRALTALWSQVFERTGGALMVTVLPDNANLPLDDAEAVYDVAAGRFGFVSVAAPILDRMVPDIALQSLPFAYRHVDEVLALSDSPAFTGLMDRELAAAGLAFLPGGTFSNGFRIIASVASKPVRTLDDLNGMRMRVPPSRDIGLLFQTLGAIPVVTTIGGIEAAFSTGRIDAEENPPSVIRNFGLQRHARWINVTNHMWTGFNTLANLDFWRSLPGAVRDRVLALLPAARNGQVAAQEASNADVLRPIQGMELVQTDLTSVWERIAPVHAAMLASFSPRGRALAEPLLHGGRQAGPGSPPGVPAATRSWRDLKEPKP